MLFLPLPCACASGHTGVQTVWRVSKSARACSQAPGFLFELHWHSVAMRIVNGRDRSPSMTPWDQQRSTLGLVQRLLGHVCTSISKSGACGGSYAIQNRRSWQATPYLMLEHLSVLGRDALLMHSGIQPAATARGRQCQARNGGQSVVPIRTAQNQSPAARMPDPTGHQACLIYDTMLQRRRRVPSVLDEAS